MAVWWLAFVMAGVAGTWLARRYALSRALLDEPGDRRSHTVPTPRGGGIAIVASLLAAIAFLAWRMPTDSPWLLAFGFGVIAIGAIGLVDDHRPLPASVRLAVHVLASAVFAAAVWKSASPMHAVAAFLMCVVLVNAWNFMDGINGIAATQAVLAALAFAAVAGDAVRMLALALVGACMGFLPFNYPRARIFMGDVGSGVLGFAVAVLLARSLGDAPWSWPVAMLAPSAFLVDTGLTLLRRVLRGERWWTPHVQHAYQVCARRWGHPRVTFAYGIWTVAAVTLALVLDEFDARFIMGWVLAWYISAALLWRRLQRLELAVRSR